MASYRRTALKSFSLANNAYIAATVTFYTVDLTTGERTGTLATLWDAPTNGNAVSNPYTLDASGKVMQPLYFDEPIIAVVGSTSLETHATGIELPTAGQYRGDWVASTSYLSGDLVTDGAAGLNTGNIYIATADHSASVLWATDLALYWELVVNIGGALSAAENATNSAAAAADSEDAAALSATEAATYLSTVTSATSVAIGSGTKTFVVAALRQFQVGQAVIASDQDNPTTKRMQGIVTAWDDGLLELEIEVDSDGVIGSGTVAAWNISIAGMQGVPGIIEDGDKGDITVSGAGTAWTVKSGVIDRDNLTASAREIDSTAMIPASVTVRDYIVGYYNETITLAGGDMQSSTGTGTIELYLSPDTTSASGTLITGGSFSVSTTVDENAFTASNTVLAGTPRWVIAKVTAATGLQNVAINVTERR